MQVILHNDDTIHGFEAAQKLAEDVLEKALKGRLGEMVTRVEVWVSDENGPKGGPDDKHCSMEAHPKGKRPVGVQNNAADVASAMRGAARKLARALDKERPAR